MKGHRLACKARLGGGENDVVGGVGLLFGGTGWTLVGAVEY